MIVITKNNSQSNIYKDKTALSQAHPTQIMCNCGYSYAERQIKV